MELLGIPGYAGHAGAMRYGLAIRCREHVLLTSGDTGCAIIRLCDMIDPEI